MSTCTITINCVHCPNVLHRCSGHCKTKPRGSLPIVSSVVATAHQTSYLSDMHPAIFLLGLPGLARGACPYMDADPDLKPRAAEPEPNIYARDNQIRDTGTDFLDQFVLDDTNSFMTSDAGGPIQDSESLKAGERGPTLLEDFIFRQKIQHFDHERVRSLSASNLIVV